MFSDYWVGQNGVPVIARGMLPENLRSVIEPANPREEFLLAKLEEMAVRLKGAETLGKEYDEYDSDEDIYRKVTLKEQADRAEREVESVRRRMRVITEAASSLLLAQGAIASTEQRMQLILDGLTQLQAHINGR